MAKVTGTSGNLKTGFKKVVKRLDRELQKVENATTKGFILSCIEVRRDMEVTPPLIPLEFGNLRASFFIITKQTAPANVRTLEVKGGKFATNTPTKVLARLQSVHSETISEVQVATGKAQIAVAMGFGAYYAAAVHEMIASSGGKPINWKRPNSGAKFFQAAIYRNIGKMVKIIAANAKIRP